MEIIAIITVISGITGAGKDILDIYTGSKSLFAKKDYTILDEMKLEKSSKETLEAVYRSLSIGKGLMKRIIVKLTTNYFFVLIFIISTLVVFIFTIKLFFGDIFARMDDQYTLIVYLLIAVINFFFFKLLFSNPFNTSINFNDWNLYNSKKELKKINRYFMSLFLTRTETKFLYQYLKLNRLRYIIEYHILANHLLKSKKSIDYEFKKYTKWILREEIISKITNDNLDTKEKRKRMLNKTINEIGIRKLTDKKFEELLEEDINKIFEKNGVSGLIDIIDRYW